VTSNDNSAELGKAAALADPRRRRRVGAIKPHLLFAIDDLLVSDSGMDDERPSGQGCRLEAELLLNAWTHGRGHRVNKSRHAALCPIVARWKPANDRRRRWVRRQRYVDDDAVQAPSVISLNAVSRVGQAGGVDIHAVVSPAIGHRLHLIGLIHERPIIAGEPAARGAEPDDLI
jgi:hypothetical protein